MAVAAAVCSWTERDLKAAVIIVLMEGAVSVPAVQAGTGLQVQIQVAYLREKMVLKVLFMWNGRSKKQSVAHLHFVQVIKERQRNKMDKVS